MKLKYTQYADSDEPVMLVNKHIGYDETEGEGILGDQFQNELMYLDSLCKKRIKIFICSPGGDVMDAMKMYHAILATKTKVDTYNGGVAASSAGFVFQAGRTRYMSDYALLMMHNPSGANDEANSTALTAFKDSIVKMLARKCSSEESKISDMMNNTTWLNAEQCKEQGLCDVIENSADMNKPRAVSAPTDAKAAWKQYANYFNSINTIQNPITMKKVYNRLKLVEGTNEDAVIASIDAIENRATTAEAEKTKVEGELSAAKEELTKVQNKVTELEGKLQEKKEAEDAAALKAKENAAELAVQNLAKDGKIKNDADTITKVKNQFIKDFDGTKEIYDAIPLNKKGAIIDSIDNKDGKVIKNTMAGVMSQIAERTKAK